MTYAPPPGYPPSYPPNYGYPAPRPSSAGKRAGTLLLILGILALLLGGCMMTGAAMYERVINTPEMQNSAEIQKLLRQLDEAGISLKTMMYIFAGMVGAYALLAIVIGILLIIRSRSRGVVVGAMVFVVLVLIFWGLNLIGSILSANIGGVLMAILIAGLHVLTLIWLIEAVRAPAAPIPATFPPQGYYPPGYTQPMPMQGYQYQAPPPPQEQPLETPRQS